MLGCTVTAVRITGQLPSLGICKPGSQGRRRRPVKASRLSLLSSVARSCTAGTNAEAAESEEHESAIPGLSLGWGWSWGRDKEAGTNLDAHATREGGSQHSNIGSFHPR